MNDLRLKPFDFNAAVARAGLRADGTPRVDNAEPGGFRAAMDGALKDVSQTQNEAAVMRREFLLGNPTVDLETTMMSMPRPRWASRRCYRCATGWRRLTPTS